MQKSYVFILISFIVSALVAFLVYRYTSFYLFVGFDKALEGVLLFSSISLGFYGACLSVIASIFNTKVVKEIMQDTEEKKEFIILVCLTLIIGFLTVTITILYQVFLENGGMPNGFYNLLSSLWSGSVTMFISMNVIFILVAFLILFNNKEKKESKNAVYEPELKNSPFNRK